VKVTGGGRGKPASGDGGTVASGASGSSKSTKATAISDASNISGVKPRSKTIFFLASAALVVVGGGDRNTARLFSIALWQRHLPFVLASPPARPDA